MPIRHLCGNRKYKGEFAILILVTYDINVEDDDGKRRLRRVAKQCVNYGTRVQKSVFECQVDAAQYVKLKHQILKEMDPKKDSVRFYSLGNRYQNKVEHFGVVQGVHVDEPLIF